jgi:hypothetical protein
MVKASHKHNTVNNYSEEDWPLLREAIFNTHIRYPDVSSENGIQLTKQAVTLKKLLEYIYNKTRLR